MNDAEKIREVMMHSRLRSKEQVDSLYESKKVSFDKLNEHITKYILAKFMLTREECEGVDFQKLSDLSLSKTMQISPELVKEFDTARSCAGATSSIAKKTLLYMAIQKAFKIELAAEKTPKVHTFEEFSTLVWDAMEQSDYWKPKLEE